MSQMSELLNVFVEGTPQPKGSWKIVGRIGQRGRMVNAAKGAPKWEKAVVEAVRDAYRGEPVDCAVVVGLRFLLERPPSRKKALFCDRKPDADKLTRCVLDCLEGTVYSNDSRVIAPIVTKGYCQSPGCHIVVRTATTELMNAITSLIVKPLGGAQ